MATKFEQTSGTYKQTSEDSDTQAKEKFGNYKGTGSIKDSGSHSYDQKSGMVQDSKDSKV